MKPICSSLTLIRGIMNESKDKTIKESIRKVFKRYEMIDPIVEQLIDKFFPEKSDENAVDLLYVDSLKQEAYDDKIQFDDQIIFEHVRRFSFSSTLTHWINSVFSFLRALN